MSQPHHEAWSLSEKVANALTEALKGFSPDLRCKIEAVHIDRLPILPEDITVSFRPPQRRGRGVKS